MSTIDLRSDTVTRPTASHARGDGGGSRSVTTCTVRTRASPPSKREAAAERFGFEAALFVSSGTQGNLLCSADPLSAWRGVCGRPGCPCLQVRGRRRPPCWGAYNPSRWRWSRTGAWTSRGWSAPSSPRTSTSPAPGCCAWRTRITARILPLEYLGRGKSAFARSSTTWRCTWTEPACSMPRWGWGWTGATEITQHVDYGIGLPVEGAGGAGRVSVICRQRRELVDQAPGAGAR